MIDYTQYAFQAPPQVIDPIPTVADYLDDYTARNEAWYQFWAYPLEGGGYGPRPSSFERRAPFIPIPDPIEDPTPPVLRSIDPVTGESYGMGNTGQEDRPVGALVRDVGGMSVPDLFAEYEGLSGTYGTVTPYVAAGVNAAAGGIPIIPALMAQQGIEDRSLEVLGAMLSQPESSSLIPNAGMFARVGTPTLTPEGRSEFDVITRPGGTQVFTTPDLFPGGYTPEPESRGGGDIGGTGRDDPQSPSNRSGGGGMWA